MTIGKLTALKVKHAKLGMHADGGGLYLQVTGAGAKSWVFRYWVPDRDPATGDYIRDPITKKVRGTAREMGLGTATVVDLAEARQRADDARRLRARNIDPIDARKDAKLQAVLDKAKALTFKEAATNYIASHRAGWRNEKHAAQWTATLETYAYPVIGALSVQAIDTALVMKVIQPIWSTKSETAGRVRGRIESILGWATVSGYRQGENPARWRGHLKSLLPARSKVRKVKHHPALPYCELPGFVKALRAQEGIAARALEFTILTAARTGEAIGANWNEIEPDGRVWTVPAERMKAGKEHRVPLSGPALAIVDGMKPQRFTGGGAVFPGAKLGRSLSNMAMLKLLERMKRDDLTVHGFRSTFKDWARERTRFANYVVEAALAHGIGDKTEAAYARGDVIDKRRELMDAWAKFCGTPAATGTVLPMRKSAEAS